MAHTGSQRGDAAIAEVLDSRSLDARSPASDTADPDSQAGDTAADGHVTSDRSDLACSDLSDAHLATQWRELGVRYHRLQCAIDRALQADADITSSEFEVLELLVGADAGKMRMSELSGQVHLSQSALSRLVAGLEKDGLVTRTMCASDRRSVFTELTETGRQRYTQARPVQRAILRADLATSHRLCGGNG
ncbi:hypothetical protein GCM10027169_05000 [Gordonia jinhuaensis]|uniref:HTH marR-type domain-containing protein n=1 Tax=Gordonia jinhuaensis TaxID=1517702 RepID=A0A916SUX4_9ACTN|nr:hypothetical protein GCM10011489_01960 [Gordonia jinhuaensis]